VRRTYALSLLLLAKDHKDGPPGPNGERKENMRSKPLSGTLLVTVKGARELDHAPIITSRARSSSKQVSETYVTLKVEGTQLAKSHPSRTDRWNEDFEITVDKANEVEIVVTDKTASDPNAAPIGLLWIRINDLVEALRRQRVGMDNGQGGWVPAGAMPGDSPTGLHNHPQTGDMNAPLGDGPPRGSPMAFGAPTADGIDAWFAVEPAGAIALHLNFSKHCYTVSYILGWLFDPLINSQRECAQAPFRRPVRRWPRSTRCSTQTQRRSTCNEWA
jgi:classical protein kinase C